MTFKQALTETQTSLFYLCPHCNTRSSDMRYYIPDAQKAQCGYRQLIKHGCDNCYMMQNVRVYADGRIELEDLGEKTTWQKCFVLLESNNNGEPIFLLLDTNRHVNPDESEEERRAHSRFHYNEHTCPTNWTQRIEQINFEGEPDPHGVFVFRDEVSLEEAQARYAKAGLQWPDPNSASAEDFQMDILFPNQLPKYDNRGKRLEG